jgi:hypothetical protein
MSPTEKKIVDMLVIRAIAEGYTIEVNDGAEVALLPSQNCDAVLNAMFSTGIDILVLRRAGAAGIVGSVVLIHGNDEDIISDHTDRAEITTLVAEAMELAGHA